MRLRPLMDEEKAYLITRIKEGIYSCIAVMSLDDDRPEGTNQEFLASYKAHSQARGCATGFKDIPIETWMRLSAEERVAIRINRLEAWFKSLENERRGI